MFNGKRQRSTGCTVVNRGKDLGIMKTHIRCRDYFFLVLFVYNYLPIILFS
jgi:hypothetical protein